MPIVGVICCNIELDAPHHTVFEQYVDEVADLYGLTPVLVPAFRDSMRGTLDTHLKKLVDRLDGFLLPGSPSNVHPHFYNRDVEPERTERFDTRRDQTSLALIRQAIQARRPILGICRGMQELNVALGGSLTWVPAARQKSGDIASVAPAREGMRPIEHVAKKTAVFSDKYLPAHTIELAADGMINSLLREHQNRSLASQYAVNSLHRQCIDQLGEGLRVEATAQDGVIEAISLRDNSQFCLGVQWHPEWFTANDSLNNAIFRSFARACVRTT